MKSVPIFNHRKRRLNRSLISTPEFISSLLIIIVLISIVIWVLNQRQNYTPGDRDLPIEFLDTGMVTAELYKPPLQRWSETGAASAAPGSSLGLFPAQILDDQWTVSLPLKEFNEETLFEKINGEAEKFLQQGFKNLQFIRIQDDAKSSEIGIELFDQGDLKGSLGIFAEYVSTDSQIETKGKISYIRNSGGLIGRKGRFFVRMVGNAESKKIVSKAEQIMLLLSSLPENDSEIPLEYKVLADRLRINPALISFQSKNVFQFDFAQDFWFGVPDPAATGRIFLHLGSSVDESRSLFSRLVDEQQYDYQIKKKTRSFAIMQHLFLKTWFVIRQEGPVVFGVEKMKDEKAIQLIIRQISDILANEAEIQ